MEDSSLENSMEELPCGSIYPVPSLRGAQAAIYLSMHKTTSETCAWCYMYIVPQNVAFKIIVGLTE